MICNKKFQMMMSVLETSNRMTLYNLANDYHVDFKMNENGKAQTIMNLKKIEESEMKKVDLIAKKQENPQELIFESEKEDEQGK